MSLINSALLLICKLYHLLMLQLHLVYLLGQFGLVLGILLHRGCQPPISINFAIQLQVFGRELGLCKFCTHVDRQLHLFLLDGPHPQVQVVYKCSGVFQHILLVHQLRGFCLLRHPFLQLLNVFIIDCVFHSLLDFQDLLLDRLVIGVYLA